ncbi:tyrosine-type recombinase/integrase [Kineosporia succinea]|uniref:Site-specific recombinase XerD n=1 Tax=Kineosporia succinea TaxID=84632 RepID=A0ABT9PCP9_9ACTN|nr:tyrosine-type recombinase/integrase [Kineosporia succinea]MDP9829950.1 site-specific recombinase XerD [Kineosporia succinea]
MFESQLEPVDPLPAASFVPDEFEVGNGDAWPLFVRAWLIAQRAQNTVKTYATAELQWRQFCGGRSLHPLDARRGDVDDWRGHIQASGGFHGRPASANTVRLKLAAVSSLYAYLVGEDILASSPAAHIKRPRGGDFSATAALDTGQAARFLEAAQGLGEVSYVAMRVLLGRGLRATELVSLDVSDVRHHFGHVTLTVTHKGGRRQELPLSPGTGHLVSEYIGERTSGPLLVNAQGGRLTYWDLYNLTVRVSRRARVGLDVTPHVLRASHATIYLDQAGAQIDRLQDGMGHASLNNTKAYDRGAGTLGRLASVATAVEDAFLG